MIAKNSDLLAAITAMADLKVAVIGEAILDSYITGSSNRLCQEAPVPVVDVSLRHDLPGGAANTALNVAALGGRPSLVSVIGDDSEATTLRNVLAQHGMTTDGLVGSPRRRTLAKSRILISGHMVARVDQGNTDALDEAAEQALIAVLESVVPASDVVLISDYGYGILTPRVLAWLQQQQALQPRPMLVDSKTLLAYRTLGVTAVKPNYHEVMRLLGEPNGDHSPQRCEKLLRREREILELTGARIAAVTLDRDGALIFERDQPPYRTYAQPSPQHHSAGAGDTFLSALALAIGAGCTSPVAAELAAAAAAVVMQKEHTATCSAAELAQHLGGSRRPRAELTAVLEALEVHRKLGRRIVFTNGCFDILHHGHVTYLQQARLLGDILIVGVNTDASIRRLKGPQRPINTLADRLGVLGALSCVDHLVAFGDDTPHRLIEAIRPDIFVKGGDYTYETLPEADLVTRLGGSVKILPLVADRSTTGMIDRICRVYSRRDRVRGGQYPGENPAYGNRRMGLRPDAAVRPA